MGRIGRAALVYFAAVFAAGGVLGIGRELLVKPRLGELAAIMVEAPLMLLACWAAARWVVRQFDVALGARLWVGLLAFGLLMVAELAGAVGLRGMEPGARLAHFTSPAGLLSLGLFAAFAAMPRLVR